MTISVTHAFTSAKPDSGDASIIQPSNWNEAHEVTGLATVAETGAYADLTGTPAEFPPEAHGHAIADVTGLQTALDGKQAAGSYQPLATVLTNTTAAFTSAQETKLAGIATGATANSSDATLLDRANHTGTQAAGTITGLHGIVLAVARGALTL